MLSLQEWIHKLEEGEGVRYIKLAAALLGLLALTAVYDIREFRGFFAQEAMDSAQLSRNIAEGQGYTTKFIRPLSVLLLQRQAPAGIPVLKEDHPDLANPPVYPVLLAGLMKVLPFQFETKIPFGIYQPEMFIAMFNQVLFFVAILLVFRVARRLFDPAVAWVSAIVFGCADLLWRFSVSGLSTMLLILLFVMIVWCLVSMEQNHREQTRGNGWFVVMAVLVGLLAGIGGLTRYSFGWLIIPVLVFLGAFFGNRRIVLCFAALLACIIVISPWVVRNYAVSQTLFGTAGYAIYQETEQFPGNRLERFLSSDVEREIGEIGPPELMKKLVVNAAAILNQDLPGLGGSLLAGFFLVSLLVPFRNPALSRLRVFTVACLGVLIMVQALGKTHLSTDSPHINSENLLVLLTPVVFIFGVGLFFVLLDQIEFSFGPLRAIAVMAFAVFMCAPIILTLLPPRTGPVAWPPYWPPRVQVLGSWFEKRDLLMSDMPWAVAWYGDRKCIWLTLDAPADASHSGGSDFFTIYDYERPVSGLYLTTLTSDAPVFGAGPKSPYVAWGDFMLRSIVNTNVPTGFPLKYATPHFIEDGQLFLSDHPRWMGRSK